MGVKIPCEFLCNMCSLFKFKSKSCVMLLRRHPDGYILFLIGDAQCIEERVGGSGTGKDAHAVDQFSSHLCVYLCPLSQVTEKLLEVENETMMKVADLEKLLLQKDKDLQVIRVSWQS